MAKNKMKKVAEILGVELGEEFRITDYGDNRYRLTEYGIEVLGDTKVWITPTYSCILNELIVGSIGIKKLQWKPKKGDYYYYPEIDTGAIISARAIYDDENSEHNIISNGLACKTRREAEELKAWIVEQVKKYRGID